MKAVEWLLANSHRYNTFVIDPITVVRQKSTEPSILATQYHRGSNSETGTGHPPRTHARRGFGSWPSEGRSASVNFLPDPECSSRYADTWELMNGKSSTHDVSSELRS